MSCSAFNAKADVIHVAAASNFNAPLRALIEQFETASGHQIRVSFASSGKLYAQIRHGAPHQVFLSADQHKVDALIDDGLADTDSRYTYAIGRLALWSPQRFTNSDPANTVKSDSLISDNYRKLSLANPRLAPYGLAAEQTLDFMSLTARTRKRWVLAENIAQAYQFVVSGNAQYGFVAYSLVRNEDPASYWLVPASHHQPIKQDLVITNKGRGRSAVREFVTYLRSKEARDLITAYGYAVDTDD